MRKFVQHLFLGGLTLALGLLLAACQSSTPTSQPSGGAATQAAGGGAATEAAMTAAMTEASGGAATEAAMTQAPVAVTTLVPAATNTAQPAISKDVNLDPAQAEDADSKAVGNWVFEPLVGQDKGTVVPWLARNWTVAEDNLAYTFELAVDTSFSDGTPLDADVVVGNFNRWFDPADSMHGSGTYKAWVDLFGGFKGEVGSDGKPKSAFDGIEKTGNLTVVLHLNRPVPDLLAKLSGYNFSIAHQTADGSYVGTGAYAVFEKTDAHLLLVPNPNYTGPYPATDNLEFPFK